MTHETRSHMTHNGQPWSVNAGEFFNDFFGAWTAQRGEQAAQRKGQASTPEGAATAANVSGLWVVFIAMRVIQWFFIVNSLWLVGIGFYHGLNRGLVCAALDILGIGGSLLSLSVGKALLHRAEALPTRRHHKVRGTFLIWLCVFWGPTFAYIPFYTQVPH